MRSALRPRLGQCTADAILQLTGSGNQLGGTLTADGCWLVLDDYSTIGPYLDTDLQFSQLPTHSTLLLEVPLYPSGSEIIEFRIGGLSHRLSWLSRSCGT
jgi:hypothetical protein